MLSLLACPQTYDETHMGTTVYGSLLEIWGPFGHARRVVMCATTFEGSVKCLDHISDLFQHGECKVGVTFGFTVVLTWHCYIFVTSGHWLQINLGWVFLVEHYMCACAHWRSYFLSFRTSLEFEVFYVIFGHLDDVLRCRAVLLSCFKRLVTARLVTARVGCSC